MLSHVPIPTSICRVGHEGSPGSFIAIFDSTCSAPAGVTEFVTSAPVSVLGHQWAVRLYPGGFDGDSAKAMGCFLVLLDAEPSEVNVRIRFTAERKELESSLATAMPELPYAMNKKKVSSSVEFEKRFIFQSNGVVQLKSNEFNIEAGKKQFATQDPFTPEAGKKQFATQDPFTPGEKSTQHPIHIPTPIKAYTFVIHVDIWIANNPVHLNLEWEERRQHRRFAQKRIKSPSSSFMHEVLKVNGTCDVNVLCKEVVFPAMKCILKGRSPVFEVMFGSGMIEQSTNEVRIEDFPSCVVGAFIMYLHTDCCAPDTLAAHPEDFFQIAVKYQVKDLQKIAEYQLAESLNGENLHARWQLAEMFTSLLLRDAITAYAARNLKSFVSAEDTADSLPIDLMLAVLKYIATHEHISALRVSDGLYSTVSIDESDEEVDDEDEDEDEEGDY